MKSILLLFFVLSTSVFFGQSTRFIYQVTMKPDAQNPSDVKTENVYLDVDATHSAFYSEKLAKRDSIMGRAAQTGGFSFNREQMRELRPIIDYIVVKDYKTGVSTYKRRIARDLYAYDEDRPIEWKISPELATIGSYHTQKAEAKFGGRLWYAWFDAEIPVQDGPYLFSGLPGLVVKVEDSKGDYSFDLKETKKIAEVQEPESRGNVIQLKRSAFNKQYAAFQKDPLSFMQLQSSGPRGGGPGGRFEPSPERRKEMETRMKSEMEKNNNPIDLDR
ncbi:MAG: GLPGLI family protein [Chryseobacterium sp. 39-10]|nr:GLPGLI family protein [Chryseobacterium sp.]OJV48948.1 MAG: GLPGLI family protein [Chryseobacterium sp. 39-10]